MSKHYTAAFKAKVVQELLKEEKTLVQIASEYARASYPTEELACHCTWGSAESLWETGEYSGAKSGLWAATDRVICWDRQIDDTSYLAEKKVSTLTREERVAQIEREESDLALSSQADLLSLSRSSWYYQPRPPSPDEIAIKHRIDELYTDYPFYGSRKMVAQLQREGMEVNRKAVQRHMREMGLVAIFPGPNLSRRKLKERVSPYLRARCEHWCP